MSIAPLTMLLIKTFTQRKEHRSSNVETRTGPKAREAFSQRSCSKCGFVNFVRLSAEKNMIYTLSVGGVGEDASLYDLFVL